MARPRKYKTPEQMEAAIDAYFASTDKPSVCGLALHLGFNSRQSLLNYEGYPGGFLDTIKRAKLRIEEHYEELLTTPGVRVAGPIFALKQMGWCDRYDVTHASELPIAPPVIHVIGK